MRLLFILSLLLNFAYVGFAQPTNAINPSVVILSVTGKITYKSANFNKVLPIQVGQFLDAADVIYPDPDASLRVVCPNGKASEFLPGNLSSGQPIPCPIQSPILGQPGATYLRVQRGGGVRSNIPYIIAPRASLVRTPNVALVWNAPSNVENFNLTVREGGNIVWQSGKLDPHHVVTGDTAQIMLPISLKAGVAYTVDICILFSTLQAGCTTDPGWSSSVDLAFYYVPDGNLDDRLDELVHDLGAGSAETLYAQTATLYQPVAQYSRADDSLGYYTEAIALLEKLQHDFSDSPLGKSAAFYLLLGDLYRHTQRTTDAFQAYQNADHLALPGTEVAANALLGEGLTTVDGNELLDYTQALDTYAGYLKPAAFLTRFQAICTVIGDICPGLPQCHSVDGADCTVWSQAAIHS